MSPFWRILNKCGADRRYVVRADSEVRFAFMVWRVCAYILWSDRDVLSVSLSTFDVLGPVQYFVISDASPWKACCAIYAGAREGGPVLLAWTTLRFPFETGANQNLREFLGSLVSLCLILVYRSRRGESIRDEFFVQWTNDNWAALKWARTHACKNLATQSANIVFVWLQLYSKISIREAAWIPGVSMEDIDRGSRDLECPSLLPELYINLDDYPVVMELMRMCDPSFSRQTIDHLDAFLVVHTILRRFMASLFLS